ncbi:GLE1-domain-containing protein [Suhomyces tanzawaensis NRRL Y-17324]|uniref:mRNA export factor GLE1 n=1 Tax=Suhomyces tanzawaensis NRRL Y-17324 TaxID=984487 RepID=A0A1E4SKV9_9ASCO|nr:GLE1-domain-containing protein [Suhomyces tanzawaensis NRRL Y-17324]ODV80139.1 GLE1-domain-containing protein [Suhomyces tanzawaensis NRRL Y-17324]
MKFELPLDMVLVADTPQRHITYNAQESVMDILDQDIIPRSQPSTGIEEVFQKIQISINIHTEQRLAQLEQAGMDTILPYQNRIENARNMGQSTSDWLHQKFQRDLQLQASQVQAIIEAEKKSLALEQERIRAEQERIRKQLQEKIRKQEEERRRKEEEDRKRVEEEKKRLEEQKKRAEEERKKAEEEKRKADEAKVQADLEEKRKLEQAEKDRKAMEQAQKDKLASQKLYNGTNFASVEKDFLEYKQDITDIKMNVVRKVASNPDLKKAVSQLKRKINPKFGQLSQSNRQFQKINDELINLILTAKPQPLAFNWILNFVAKAIVDQAETEVIVQPAAALPLARLAISLLQQFPELEYYLSARFIKKCPLIIGFTRTIDTEEGRLQMGWRRRENKWEDEVKYDERLSGICTVWATMTRIPSNISQSSLYRLDSSWRFLARLMNTDANLLANVHFSVAANWWEATAKDFLKAYGHQGNKLLQVLTMPLLGSVSDKRFPAAARLLILGEEWFNNRKIQGIPEMTA